MSKFIIQTNLPDQEVNKIISGAVSRSLKFHKQSFKGRGCIDRIRFALKNGLGSYVRYVGEK